MANNAASDPWQFPHKALFCSIFADQVYLVGGSVRDGIRHGHLDLSKDIDLIVIGHSYEEIESALRTHGKTNTVGKSFAVVKFTIDGVTYDIAIPRADRKRSDESHSHRNFIIDAGPHISLADDLQRRDFTCNSIALRLSDNAIIDPYHGQAAIAQQLLAVTNRDAFADDPLRILRAARFASVLGFAIDDPIYELARTVPLQELSAERVADELFRLLLESQCPSIGLNAYWQLNILQQLFGELGALTLTIQDAIFHPETDAHGHHTVWAHTVITVDIAQKLSLMYALDNERRLTLLLAALLHDIGKAGATRWEHKRGRLTVTSLYHDSGGLPLAEALLDRIKLDSRNHFPMRATILNLIRNHHRIYELYRNRSDIGYKAIARLVNDMAGEDELLLLLDFADRQSREVKSLSFTELDSISQWFLSKKNEYQINQETTKPLIMGRDLLAMGIPPGKAMGDMLQKLYDLQLDGEFKTKEEGLALFMAQFPTNS